MQFEYISADTISIVIDDIGDNTCHELVETLRKGDMSVRRALQKYSVSVYMNVFKDLYSQGCLTITAQEYLFLKIKATIIMKQV